MDVALVVVAAAGNFCKKFANRFVASASGASEEAEAEFTSEMPNAGGSRDEKEGDPDTDADADAAVDDTTDEMDDGDIWVVHSCFGCFLVVLL